ncbi:hypothetical protein BDN70DRAFT_934111 [Pholiota conissans]|uniref:Zn(2)-C6 fungal-type domain-containing protein n=1 Tax=Pholiota conissans TaxID=109636 RepID=A0A9P5YXM2_9AGAR|nr:hypothetical protein BDN70DRAFT_934111 [Pholiota conissans]
MHPNPYSHPYSPYPQYQPMMMYPPPRHSMPPDQQQHHDPVSSASAQGGGKRKRKSVGEPSRGGKDRASDDETAASGSDAPRASMAQQKQAAIDLKKRTKTQRACDSCRSRKIRCDVIADSEPALCQHCKQYGFECTFFLPITETRFKKKKLEEEAAEKEKAAAAAAASVSSKAGPSRSDATKRDIGVFGPTSPAHLLHSQATINSRIYETYDQRYQHTFEVSKSGDGLIQVQKPAADDQPLAHPKQLDLHIERDVIENLLNAYFADVAPILPIVTEAEFLATPNPAPVLVYSMCLVAAARREVPQKVFDSIRFAVNSVIKGEDVLSTASIVNVQALLILCMTGDCHSQYVPNALSALWIRLGSAIRMAQDLGLHRAESVKQSIELRRRLWGACLICDRWTSIAYGHPYMIDVQDCDARLPSSGDPTDLYMDELVRLSIILGRVQKTIYSPSGLTFITDDQLYELLNDMQQWQEGLPEHLKFRGPDTSREGGLLQILYSCVSMMFWRVFMRISYSCPAHLKFGLTVETWSALVKMTADSIDWLDANERVYDVWLLVAYAATSCALVQYHTCIRRKDEEAQASLRKLRDCTAEIIALLYEATQDPQPIEAPALNPTGGVTVKQPVLLDYKKDPTRPGGGVFIAPHGGASAAFTDVPAGTIISGSTSGDEGGEGGGATGGGADSEGEVVSLVAGGAAEASFGSFMDETDNDRVPPPSVLPLLGTPTTTPSGGFANAMANANSSSRGSYVISSPSPFVNASRPPMSSVRDDRRTHTPSNVNANMDANMYVDYNNTHDRRPAAAASKARQQQQGGIVPSAAAGAAAQPAPLVNITPLGREGPYTNVNPAMNLQQAQAAGAHSVQVMNALDGAGTGGTSLADLANADGFLEGIPGGMFDWGQWDTFFSRIGGGAAHLGFQQPQQQNPPAGR